MAIVRNNPVVQNVSGKIGNGMVVKQYPGGKTVLARLPGKYKRTKSEISELYTDRFKAAVQFARDIMSSEELMAPYRKRLAPGQRIYNLIIREFMMEERRKAGQSTYKKFRR